MEAVMDDSAAEYIADLVMELQSKENTDLPRYKAQLAETEKAIANMLNAIQQGIFNKSTKGRLDELEAAKSDLEVKILQEEMKKPVLKREQVVFWIKRFRKLDVSDAEQRQRLIDSFVNAVYLYDDRLVVTFNYKEDSKTVGFGDIKKMDSLARNSATQNPANSGDCGVAVGSDYGRCLRAVYNRPYDVRSCRRVMLRRNVHRRGAIHRARVHTYRHPVHSRRYVRLRGDVRFAIPSIRGDISVVGADVHIRPPPTRKILFDNPPLCVIIYLARRPKGGASLPTRRQ
jgi:hypothetical protein